MTPRKQALFWSHVEKMDGGCWNWTGSKCRGYGEFSTSAQGHARAHRVSYELAHGPIPKGMHCLHRCDNAACVNPEHLFLGTNVENMADMVSKGRSPKGAANGVATLTDEKVLQIRALRRSGKSSRELAVAFGVKPEHIRRIVRRGSWTHLPEAEVQP